MASWSEFTAAEPDLAAAIRALLQQYGPGMGYLATVRADGGPRVHPVSPVITDEGLYCFVVDSAKRRDLERDGRYALHSYPPEESDDEAYLTGHAHRVTDPAVTTRLADALRASPHIDWRLFELTIETAMLRRHGPAGALPLAMSVRYPPITLTWHAPDPHATPPQPGLAPHSTTTVTLATPTVDHPLPPTNPAAAPAPPAAAATSLEKPATPPSPPTEASTTDQPRSPKPPTPPVRPLRPATRLLQDLSPATTSA
ncbi:pyridoxamine 5'-phosphate oxidase [Pseudosporangium ferrugineum]|uniref:Pyridoxamine 5'-phosphate oxidase n=1 Tax=Pseudosporangium ferrugineum TaxID=439699 RepID=A0A2T0S117_9ACTN|nr:pyridoxamine 5'-phosphate oxidase [Pseudosporangium ferrugineum]